MTCGHDDSTINIVMGIIIITDVDSEVFKPLVFRQPLFQFRVDVHVAPRVFEESPELLQAIQLAYKSR